MQIRYKILENPGEIAENHGKIADSPVFPRIFIREVAFTNKKCHNITFIYQLILS